MKKEKQSSLSFGDEDFSSVVVEEQEKNVVPHQPLPIDADWTSYVLTLLQPDEMNKGKYPTVAGLRRLTPVLLGKIIISESKVIQCPTPDNGMCCVINHELHILENQTNDVLVFSGAVDVSESNAAGPFKTNLVSSCCTKAEGKALRRALKLNVIVGEEIGLADKSEDNEKINEGQITFIDSIASRNNLNVEKVVTSLFDVKTIKKLSYEQAASVNSKLSEYQRDHQSIPADLKGYDSDWKSSF